MGSELNKVRRKVNEPIRSLQRPIEKGIKQGLEKPFRTGASAAARDAAKLTAKQQQMEKIKLAEVENEIATKRIMANKGGRQSLIKSSPTGMAQNLGGTQ